jgi:thiamine-monophosphate kinase
MKTIRQLGEFGLIRTLARQLPARRARVGVGDDCAVLPAGDPQRYLLFACDPVVEGVHYRPQTPAYRVGWKAVGRNLSDIAAMGGQPRWAVVSLGLRPDTSVRYVQGLYRGLRAAAQRFDCEIVGGDTTHVRHEQFLVVAILGDVGRDRLATRAGAKPGDVVFVTGTLGGSLKGKHLTFTPRLAEARWLVQHCRVHSMIDVSDGLASDLQRLVEANRARVGFEIDADAVPTTTNLPAALRDGEDFELLFTVAAREAQRLPQRWPFATRLTAIGRVVPGPGRIWLVSARVARRPVTPQGYDHFVQR